MRKPLPPETRDEIERKAANLAKPHYPTVSDAYSLLAKANGFASSAGPPPVRFAAEGKKSRLTAAKNNAGPSHNRCSNPSRS